ncbi:hypothetical protein ONS95_011537 [Cadophora gregata]|uniref:uncharacterized protein n=1 Tax=Cadophora gregata TaxID=51156 RepID=UPI0026DC2FC0|nr:uncharacterized protein ONS95_011537 [Cadophora gregata]KAK0120129.1 hypothetical protein ONS95_011537 [Cadophora gregata]KAK0121157.1 hypothetical protein ONS96_011336 [Cadophora gregata f. sp. sojae]
MSSPTKPLLLFCSTPGHGHVMPVRAVAKTLVARGYEAIFTTNDEFKSMIEELGAKFVPLLGRANFSMSTINTLFPDDDRHGPPAGPYRLARALKYIFGSTIPAQHESVQVILRGIEEREPGRQVIVIHESMFWGTLPILLGAEGLKPAGVISLGISPLPLAGPGIPPFGLGLPFDSSPAGIEKYEGMSKVREEMYEELTESLNEIFAGFGLDKMKQHIMDLHVTAPHRWIQMCIPSLEYPRANPPPGLRFAGGLPGGHRGVTRAKPDWWEDVTVNAAKKRIVFVSQGTATDLYEKLIIPTLQGLAECEDILVVAALGREGAVLPDDFQIPKNARVGDFIPFDELLPYADAFVTNGGYGGFQHAVSHGTPLIVAGLAADKPEVAARVEWAGLGVNMRTEVPTPEAVKEAVEKVLSDGKYKERAKALEGEVGKYDVFEAVIKSIEELCAGDV